MMMFLFLVTCKRSYEIHRREGRRTGSFIHHSPQRNERALAH